MRAAPVTGHAGNSGYHGAFVVLIEAEKFFIDLAGHFVHAAGNVLLRLGIAGEIQPVRSAVGGRGMAETTFYAQRGLPFIHGFLQIVVADIFGQYFEIHLWLLIVQRPDGGHPDDHKGDKGYCD